MALRAALFLTAAFLSAALALAVLPACSDEGSAPLGEINCEAYCGNDCFRGMPLGRCECVDFIDDVCPLHEAVPLPAD